MKHVVKCQGHLEKYDGSKVYRTAFYACRNAHLSKAECSRISKAVQKAVSAWMIPRTRATCGQIFRKVVRELGRHDKDAAFLYETHRDIS
ncbi:hypothetical protein HY642_01990 [Candidatus Woesearchaeota archaeon]|nr:hypothetical protein [Candidatus Woesearchaeota archaeon]